ncbi:MAG: gfo/Idh/MocA family oxidoreductase [Candidatus Hydrogenedentota bacterium]|nr:MAG: gfo/Idh/MocA family oxidoreductase [Candidatus Hydrogenedentota bacterium]
MRFALIGCGRIAFRHVEALREIPEARLVAVCDLKSERAEAYAKEEGIPAYTNYHEMLSREEIDVVNIITPSGMHAEHALDVMRRYRKHVVVEKPMALRIEDAEEMIGTAEKEGVQLHVVMQNRFNKAVQKIREAVDENRFGRMVLGTVRLRWCRPQRYYDRDPWRGTWAFDGGALTNQAVHHIDLLQWMMGEVEEVSAAAQTRLVDVEVEDTAVAWLRFSNGALGAIEATTAARPDDFEASISLLGEHGTVVAEGASVNRITLWTFTDIDVEEFSEAPPNVYGFGHNVLLANVTDSVLGRARPLVDGLEGIKPLRLLHAIYSSIEQNARVRLDQNPRSRRLGVLTEKDLPIRRLYISEP